MTITRREICVLLPGLLPAAAALDAFAETDTSLPSANYPYDKLLCILSTTPKCAGS